MGMHYEGWIKPLSEDKDQFDRDTEFLAELGIQIGRWDTKKKRFEDCIIPASAHAQVTMLLGRFDMDLEAVQTEEEDEENPDKETE